MPGERRREPRIVWDFRQAVPAALRFAAASVCPGGPDRAAHDSINGLRASQTARPPVLVQRDRASVANVLQTFVERGQRLSA